MHKQYYISKYCSIQDNRIEVNDTTIYEEEYIDFTTFIKGCYKFMQIDYPKFYKMDNLSKLAFIAAECVLKDEVNKCGIALVLSNRTGSLDTDVRHQESILDRNNYYPSPAVFVYTLANICAGEIGIRHGLIAENAFFINDTYDVTTVSTYADYLLISGKAEKVLCGWVELFADKYKAVLYLVEQTGAWPHQIEQIEKLF